MTMRFPAFRQIRHRKTAIKLVRVDSDNYDRSLFPVNLDSKIHHELILGFAIPSILRNKFQQKGIAYLGQLQGLDVPTFLSWRGFGPTCFTALCHFLDSLRSGKLERITSQESDPSFNIKELPSEILAFRVDTLNLPTLLKTQLANQIQIHTIEDFLNAYENGRLYRPGIGFKTIQQVFNEIDTLRKAGTQPYLENVALNNQSFLQIISLAKDKLDPREKLILDHRFCPLTVNFLTLEAIAQRMGLTRERVRQLEQGLVKKFQSGTLREFGWAIRRNTLRLFTKSTQEFRFEEFLSFPFLKGCVNSNSRMPATLMFLDKVFYATFLITKTTIQLTDNARRNFT